MSGLATFSPHVRRRAANRDTRRRSYMTQAERDECRVQSALDRGLLKKLGAALYELRAEAGLRQSDLAARTGYSFKQISNIERAQNWPSPALYEAICGVFGIKAAK